MAILSSPILLPDTQDPDKCLTIDCTPGFYYQDCLALGRHIYWVDVYGGVWLIETDSNYIENDGMPFVPKQNVDIFIPTKLYSIPTIRPPTYCVDTQKPSLYQVYTITKCIGLAKESQVVLKTEIFKMLESLFPENSLQDHKLEDIKTSLENIFNFQYSASRYKDKSHLSELDPLLKIAEAAKYYPENIYTQFITIHAHFCQNSIDYLICLIKNKELLPESKPKPSSSTMKALALAESLLKNVPQGRPKQGANITNRDWIKSMPNFLHRR